MKNEKISVIMSVYNGEKYVKEAVESILAQTYTNFEFIIIDDGSTDNTVNILSSYNDERIVFIQNPENIGLVGNLKKGVGIAKGQFIARMDADDISFPYRFKMQLDFFDKNPEISFLGSSVIFFDDEGYEFVGYQPTHHDEIKCKLLAGFTMLHPSVMIRKSFLDLHEINYDTNFLYSEDHDLWVRSIRLTKFANINEPLIKMRNHSGKLTKNFINKYVTYSNIIRRRQLDELELNFSNEELEVFNKLACNVIPNNKMELKMLDNFLRRILIHNKAKNIFNQTVLTRCISDHFRSYCRYILISKNPLGKYYWKSKIRKEENFSARQLIGMLYRTIRT